MSAKMSDRQLMDRIISRFESESSKKASATSSELSIATTQLLDSVRQLKVAFEVSPPSSAKVASKKR
jgi:hypothetical protein